MTFLTDKHIRNFLMIALVAFVFFFVGYIEYLEDLNHTELQENYRDALDRYYDLQDKARLMAKTLCETGVYVPPEKFGCAFSCGSMQIKYFNCSADITEVCRPLFNGEFCTTFNCSDYTLISTLSYEVFEREQQ